MHLQSAYSEPENSATDLFSCKKSTMDSRWSSNSRFSVLSVEKNSCQEVGGRQAQCGGESLCSHQSQW